MTNPEYPSHDPPLTKESAAVVTRRYSPTGNRETIEKLKRLKQLTLFKAATFAPDVDDDIREIISSRVFDDVAENPAATYQKAVELDKNYEDAIRAEEELANDFLMQLAEPYMIDPPQEQWGIVRGIGEDRAEFMAGMRVPFTQSEIEAINEAKKARQMILSSEHAESRATRNFWMDSQLFPSDIRIGPVTHSLTNRPEAIWGIMTAARAAEDALTCFLGTANQPKGDAARLFTTVRNLPNKLIRHKPTQGK